MLITFIRKQLLGLKYRFSLILGLIHVESNPEREMFKSMCDSFTDIRKCQNDKNIDDILLNVNIRDISQPTEQFLLHLILLWQN